MGTEIYYFSGTGNSLYITLELQKRIPETELMPIVGLLDMDVVKTSAETVGIIFPIHLAMAPQIVIEFLKKMDLKSAGYIFAIATREGSQHRAFADFKKVLGKKGKDLNSYFTLNMASNDPKFKNWHPAAAEELADIESEIQNNLEYIQDIILNKDESHEKDTHFTVHMPLFPIFSLVLPVLNKFYNVDFYVNSKCTGCGTCKKVCLSGKIKMVNGKPVWQKEVDSFFCHACLNYCPEQAVQIKSNLFLKSYTEENDRYSHPYATADDIAGQKNNLKYFQSNWE
jgi:formate hydrogenlyase subunit 6/NADH:ubiquinone oxidoreductase subunit I